MKVMWLCNTLIPESGIVNSKKGKPESWISASYLGLLNRDDVSLVYLYPNDDDVVKEEIVDKTIFVNYKKEKTVNLDFSQVNQFKSLVKKYEPDIIHIFGSEFSHTLAMVEACECLGVSEKVVISIQGLVSVINRHYNAYLPEKIIKCYSFRDFLKFDNIEKGRKKIEVRGKYEEESIRKTKHIIGRTDWDRACVKRINPKINYYHCNETMRKAFYEKEWNYENCEKNSIFFSQWYAPLKGLHLVLEAVASLKKKYPNVHLYTTGENLLDNSFSKKIRRSYYHKYCAKLIKEYKLENSITFLGFLNEREMCDRFLKSNVFVSASSIENSPNSVGEAMLLGVPTVASDVGGVKNLLSHNVDGFIYPADEPYMLDYYVSEIFEKEELKRRFSENSRKTARELYDAKKNTDVLFEIYEKILKNN